MPESEESLNIQEIGQQEVSRLIQILKDREEKKYNVAGWTGTSNDLEMAVGNGSLVPASTFAVVAEGLVRYKRTDPWMQENTPSMRDLSEILQRGADIYDEASKIDQQALKDQIKAFIESHGGVFDQELDWGVYIRERAERLKKRADTIDEVNR